MNKINIENMNNQQLEYSFLKMYGMLLGDDTVILKQKNGNISCYNISRFSLIKDIFLLKDLLKQINYSIKIEKKGNFFFTEINNNIIKDENEAIVLIKSYLLKKTDGFVEVPKLSI